MYNKDITNKEMLQMGITFWVLLIVFNIIILSIIFSTFKEDKSLAKDYLAVYSIVVGLGIYTLF